MCRSSPPQVTPWNSMILQRERRGASRQEKGHVPNRQPVLVPFEQHFIFVPKRVPCWRGICFGWQKVDSSRDNTALRMTSFNVVDVSRYHSCAAYSVQHQLFLRAQGLLRETRRRGVTPSRGNCFLQGFPGDSLEVNGGRAAASPRSFRWDENVWEVFHEIVLLLRRKFDHGAAFGWIAESGEYLSRDAEIRMVHVLIFSCFRKGKGETAKIGGSQSVVSPRCCRNNGWRTLWLRRLRMINFAACETPAARSRPPLP